MTLNEILSNFEIDKINKGFNKLNLSTLNFDKLLIRTNANSKQLTEKISNGLNMNVRNFGKINKVGSKFNGLLSKTQ